MRKPLYVVGGGLIAALLLVATANGGQEFAEKCDPTVDVAWPDAPKERIVSTPEITLTDAETEALVRGEIVTRTLDSPAGGKMGWMRFFASADPVTVAAILADNESYTVESPEYKATGSLAHRKRTFMPYTWENIECEEGGRTYVYQLLVMPLISPRKANIRLCRNVNGFPWEMAWHESDTAPCEKLASAEMAPWREKAVAIERNRGSWLVSPIPPELRRSPADLNRADVRYFVDTNPGGSVGKMEVLANAAQRQAMPVLAGLINQHGKTYDRFMQEHKTPEQLADFRQLRQRYIDAWKPIFDALGAAETE